MTREEEIQRLKEFIEKNGVIVLPPDQRTEKDWGWTKKSSRQKNKKKS